MNCSYLFATLDQQSSVDHLRTFYNLLATTLRQRYEKKEPCTPALSAMIGVSLNAFSQHRHDLTGPLVNVVHSLDISRQYHLEVILRLIERLTHPDLQDRDRRYHLGVSLELLALYVDLLGIHPDLLQSKRFDMSFQEKLRLTALVSSRMFSSEGLFGLLKEQERVFDPGQTTNVEIKSSEDRCGVEYLISRLTNVEVLLGVQDYKLDSGVVDASRRIYECKVDQASEDQAKDADCH